MILIIKCPSILLTGLMPLKHNMKAKSSLWQLETVFYK